MSDNFFLLEEFIKTRDFKRILPELVSNKLFREEVFSHIEKQTPHPYQEYCSWLFIHLAKENPQITKNYQERIIDCLFESSNQSVLRNLLACINELKLNNYREGELIDLLVNFLLEKSHKVALHVYAIYLLISFIKKYPELRGEVQNCIELLRENGSPALHSAYKRFLKST